jgi:mutator protein MutT
MTRTVAGGLLIRGERLLLAKRSETKAFYPGVWDLVGGHCEPGETPVETLVRELEEEIGVRATGFEELRALELAELRYHVFVVTSWYGEPRLANDEHSELRWVSLEEARELELADASYPELLRAALEATAR